MDRGRCGLDLESNRFLREKKLTRNRNEHLERLKKIKHRKPGSSSTLNNTPPESMFLDRFKSDPRKVSKRKEKNNTIERENKVLLQRISHILTAPPRITDESYVAMKKLITTLNDTNQFNQKLKKKYTEQFFERVNKTTPYYNHKAWERQYAEQLKGQKFMRQVHYKRPDNWVDPFQEKPPEEDYDEKRARLRHERQLAKTVNSQSSDGPDAFARSTGDLANSNAGVRSKHTTAGGPGHVNKVKKLRASKSNPHPRKKESFGKEKEVKAASNASEIDKPDDEGVAFDSRLLARVERDVTLHSPSSARALEELSHGASSVPATPKERRKNELFQTNTEEAPELVPACVLCSLVENAYLYITVDGVESLLHAEALVHVNTLFLSDAETAEGKTQENFPLDDEGAQEMLAVDIIEHISLLRQQHHGKSDVQVILPWSGPGGGAQASTRRSSVGSSLSQHAMEATSSMNALDDPELLDHSEGNPLTSTSSSSQHHRGHHDTAKVEADLPARDREQEDLSEYFAPISVCCGVRAEVSSGVQAEDEEDGRRLLRKKKPHSSSEFLPENVFLLVRVTRVGEEKARVSVLTLRDSVNLFKRRPAVPANTRLELTISLPSVLTVEADLMEQYFKNAVKNIRIEHSQETGENVLILQ